MLIDIYQKKSIKFQLLIYLKNLINLRKNKLNLVKRKKYKIGINWIVPQSWKIKSYPKKWKKVNETLNNYKNVKFLYKIKCL